jgi:hypothetical protein
VLDKWYVDTLLADSSVLLVYLGRIIVAGVPLLRVTSDLFLPDGTRISGSSIGLRFSCAPGRLRCGPATIEVERLRFETTTLSGDLTFSARDKPFYVRDPFLSRGEHRLSWQVEVPDADVRGELRSAGRRVEIEGRGYRDRVWLDFPHARVPLRTLRWGRAIAGPHAATWVTAETDRETISLGWQDGVMLDGPPPTLALSEERSLVHGPVVDLEGLRLGPLRPLLRLCTHNPVQHKWAARAKLGGVDGRAVHELVSWPQGHW